MGVDPEVILLIEAVWTAERYPPNHDPRGVYRGVARPLPAELTDVEP